MDLEEIIRKWDSVGLLTGLSEEYKSNVAMIYEKVAQILINDDSIDTNLDFITTTIFPIIYRICRKGYTIKNPRHLLIMLNEFIHDNREAITDNAYSNVDMEAEMCAYFTEYYCEWLEDNEEIEPIKYIIKHKL